MAILDLISQIYRNRFLTTRENQYETHNDFRLMTLSRY